MHYSLVQEIMSNYFSDFIRRFGGKTLGLTSYDNVPSEYDSVPKISFIALYNPTWARADDESLEGLSKQILLFVTLKSIEKDGTCNDGSDDSEQSTAREKLNMIGLIRGSCSLLADFGSLSEPVTIEITNGAIIVIEIEPKFYLAICLMSNSYNTLEGIICTRQMVNLAQNSYQIFKLNHLSLPSLVQSYGRETSANLMNSHWIRFLRNFNLGADVPFGPSLLRWPNRLNHRGFFGVLPRNSYKRSSIKFSEATQTDLNNLVYGSTLKPSGYVVANVDEKLPKHSGIIHMSLGNSVKLEENSVITIFNMFDAVKTSNMLNPDFFKGINKTEDLETLLRKEWQKVTSTVTASQEVEFENKEPENRDSSLVVLDPMRLTNALVLLPLSDTVSGIKNLGLAVTELIYDAPNWFNGLNYFGTTSRPENNGIPENISEELPSDKTSEWFLIGLCGENITRFLSHIPSIYPNGRREMTEYLLVAYVNENNLLILFYESGLEELEKHSFYTDIKNGLLQPLFEIVEGVSAGDLHPLGASLGTLPDSLEAAERDKKNETGLANNEVDNDFFFIVYDMKKSCYQTSLPDLPLADHISSHTSGQGVLSAKGIFHLHDHLITQFALPQKQGVFEPECSVHEQLHKFSIGRSVDWLIYSIRHEGKVIVIMRNSKQKTSIKPLPTSQNNYLMKVADNMYGAANLGFLESLGSDVRVWLGGVETEPGEEAP